MSIPPDSIRLLKETKMSLAITFAMLDVVMSIAPRQPGTGKLM